MRRWLGASFLAAQAVWVLAVHATGSPDRYFSWAPNDYMVNFSIRVHARGQELTPEEIVARYRLPSADLYEYPVGHLQNLIRQYEQTYGRADGARVELTYRINGGAPQTWTWM